MGVSRYRRGPNTSLLPKAANLSGQDVPFPAWLYHELRRLEALVDSRRIGAGGDWKDFNLVFSSRKGNPQDPAWLEQASDSLEKLIFGDFRATLAQSESELTM